MQARTFVSSPVHGRHSGYEAALGRLRLTRRGLFPILTEDLLFNQTLPARTAAESSLHAHEETARVEQELALQIHPRPFKPPVPLFEDTLTIGEYLRVASDVEERSKGVVETSNRWAPIGPCPLLFHRLLLLISFVSPQESDRSSSSLDCG